jgi:hypothetical protein
MHGTGTFAAVSLALRRDYMGAGSETASHYE